jgi:signal transduction histidine kinase
MSAVEPSPLPDALRLESALRRRLAADLHDDPLQALAAVAMALELARMQRGEDADLREIEDAAREATRGLRRMLAEITGPELDGSLADALKAHVDALGGRCAIRVKHEPIGALRQIVGLIAAEAAAAGVAGVRISHEDGTLTVLIEGAEGMDLELAMARASVAGGTCSGVGADFEIRIPDR